MYIFLYVYSLYIFPIKYIFPTYVFPIYLRLIRHLRLIKRATDPLLMDVGMYVCGVSVVYAYSACVTCLCIYVCVCLCIWICVCEMYVLGLDVCVWFCMCVPVHMHI